MAVQSNLAATLGGWSARHRIAAIAGWVVLVIVTMLIGSAVGQVTMKQSEYGAGVLLPSAMALLGDRNWYLPRWLSWLPPKPPQTPGPAGPDTRPAAPEPAPAGRV